MDFICVNDHTHIPMHTHTHAHIHSSYMTLVGVNEMHGRVYPNYVCVRGKVIGFVIVIVVVNKNHQVSKLDVHVQAGFMRCQ